jgi:putative ABC transport system permease protein
MARAARARKRERQSVAQVWHPGPLRLLWLAARRVRRGGSPLVAVGLGMLIAIALLCAVPLYIRLGADAQLQAALRVPPAKINIEIAVLASDSRQATAKDILDTIDGDAPLLIQQVAPTKMSYVEGPNLGLNSINGQPVSKVDPLLAGAPPSYLQPFAYAPTELQQRMHLYAGHFPSDAAPRGVPEVLVTPQTELHVGDVIDTTILGVNDETLTVKVAGIWFPKDPNDPYWNGRSFLPPQSNITSKRPQPVIFPIVMTPTAFFGVLGSLQPSPSMTVHDVYFTQPKRLTAQNMGSVASAVLTFRSHISATLGIGQLPGYGGTSSGVSFLTGLPSIVATVQQQFTLSDLPLYIVVVQVIGLALLFVIAMASLLVESQSSEIVVLKSRGASDAQTLGALTGSGLVPAVLAVAVGPFLAVALSLVLVRLGIPTAAGVVASDTNAAYITRSALTTAVIAPALAGAVLGLAALAVPAWQVARLDVLTFRREQARPTQVPIWRRYYLDLALAGFCVVGYLELSQFGGLDVRNLLAQNSSGNPSVLLLAAPALLLLAGGLVLLRIVPPLLKMGFQRAARARGATGVLAFAQLTRGAARFSRLTLLLTLAVAMGLFALTFASSLDRNAADRAEYQTGGDERVVLNQGIVDTPETQRIAPHMAQLPGVIAATGLVHTSAQTPTNEGNRQIPVTAVDPATFASAAYWRADYANQSLASLLDGLRRHVAGAAAGDTGHPIWALISPIFAQTYSLQPGDSFVLTSQFGDSSGTHFVVGAEVNDFPTLFDSDSGYIVVNIADVEAASPTTFTFTPRVAGPVEWWLRTTPAVGDATARAAALTNPDLLVQSVTKRSDLEQRFKTDPVAAGMTALLLAGALLAACLAVLGGMVQAAGTARQRIVQFAILRTLGLSRRELTNIFLLEQLVMYNFGLLGGVVLGIALSAATLPYLEFGTLLTDTEPPGIPPYVLVVDARNVLFFLGALVLAFLIGLVWQRQVAVRVVLDRALRLGED